MTATIHSFASLVREHRLPCPCRPGHVCATHRCIDLAAVIRGMRDEDLDALFIAVDKHRAALDLVLEVLDGITGGPSHERDTTDLSPGEVSPAHARPRVGITKKHRKREEGVGHA